MLKHIPNILSFSRVLWALVFYALIMNVPLINIAPLLGLFILIEASDLLDGMVARMFKSTSDVGKLLDPVCDVSAHFICLFALYTLYMVPPLVVVVFIMREVWVTFLRALLLRQNIVLAAGWAGKLKTWVYAIAILMSILLLPQSRIAHLAPTLSKNLIIVYLPMLYYLGAALSVFSALTYVVTALQMRKPRT